MLDETWCRFLHDHKFLLGISLDGPNGPWGTSGSGVAIAFGACVEAPSADWGIIPVALMFTNQAPAVGTMSFIPDPKGDALEYVDCDAFTLDIDPYNTGVFDWAGMFGTHVCVGEPATIEATWGHIKAHFSETVRGTSMD